MSVRLIAETTDIYIEKYIIMIAMRNLKNWSEEDITWRDFTGGFMRYISLFSMVIGTLTMVSSNLNTLHTQVSASSNKDSSTLISPDALPYQYDYLGYGGNSVNYSYGRFDYSSGGFMVRGEIYDVSGSGVSVNNPYVIFNVTRHFGDRTLSGGHNYGTDYYEINETTGLPMVTRSFQQTFDSIGYTNDIMITVAISIEPSFSTTVTSGQGDITGESVMNQIAWDFFGGN